MDNDGISTKVSVLGDKEYKKALQDIGQRLTVLNTEMAATTSAFGEQADSMEAMQAKAAGLKSVYEAQAEKVRLIAEQLNKAKGEYEENSKQVQDLQIALNRARAAMNKTGSEIQKNDRAIQCQRKSLSLIVTQPGYCPIGNLWHQIIKVSVHISNHVFGGGAAALSRR